MQIKTAALIGLGAIGSFIAPRLNEALGPGNFKVVAKGARKRRLQEEGTTINGKRYVFEVADPGEPCEPADLVIVLVKHNALPQAVQDIRPLVGPNTMIVSFMNGITSEETLAEAYGWPRVIYGLSRVSVVMEWVLPFRRGLQPWGAFSPHSRAGGAFRPGGHPLPGAGGYGAGSMAQIHGECQREPDLGCAGYPLWRVAGKR